MDVQLQIGSVLAFCKTSTTQSDAPVRMRTPDSYRLRCRAHPDQLQVSESVGYPQAQQRELTPHLI
ncbi:hypothetical protein C8Q80DRAFT_1212999 [Daedaleopsis nitida]|nr:hypothetical protein C8Q80DRAFT_1212999 [Daedaleopsis nitida]